MRFVVLLALFVSLPALCAGQQSFNEWLDGFKHEALQKGITQDVIDNAFLEVNAPNPDVIELDHRQPENTLTFSEYSDNVLTDKRISDAQENYSSHKKVLRKIEAKYKVPASILLALWAVESNFGNHQGSFSVIDSLATLAYDGRRSQFFRTELFNALKILQTENVKPEDMIGSWAGAMGQTQFMPSSYLKFAVDFDNDGKKDIWGSDADALASIANYLHSKGWDEKYGWGMEVEVPDSDSLSDWRNDKEPKTLKEWRKLGFTREDGERLPKTKLLARLVIPDDESTAFLVFPNYDVLMDWNRSIYFATSVGLLADKIGKK